jgi:hypothetical protein
VDTTNNFTICAKGTYNPPAGFTAISVTAMVVNDASNRPGDKPPPTGTQTVAITAGGAYAFTKGTTLLSGASCGMTGFESVAYMALWFTSTKAGFPNNIDSEPYLFKGRASDKTDCG